MSEQSESVSKLATALIKVQKELKPAKKDSENPFCHSSYADLVSVWDACRDLLAKNELAVIQTGDGDNLVTTLVHSSGEWVRGKMRLTPAKQNDPQAQGSALTYLRRYSLAAIVGIVSDDDDDGETAMGRGRGGQTAQTPAKSNGSASQTPPAGRSLLMSSFTLSEPTKSSKGKIYRTAMDEKQNRFYVWDDAVCADLQIADGERVTVEVEGGQYPKIVRVVPNQLAEQIEAAAVNL
jgi:hypothetical protein